MINFEAMADQLRRINKNILELLRNNVVRDILKEFCENLKECHGETLN